MVFLYIESDVLFMQDLCFPVEVVVEEPEPIDDLEEFVLDQPIAIELRDDVLICEIGHRQDQQTEHISHFVVVMVVDVLEYLLIDG